MTMVEALCVLYGVIHRLLRNSIQMRGHRFVMNQYSLFSFKAASDPEHVLHFGRMPP
jgi:hypothetical protein